MSRTSLCIPNYLALAALLLAAACSSDSTGEATLALSFAGLPALGDDFVYEGWLLTSDGVESAGRFSIDEAGEPVPATFAFDRELIESANSYVLTIEPATGDEPGPAPTHVVAGPMTNDGANLTIDAAGAFGTDFAGAIGDFILATPSTSNIDTDEGQGVWFLDPTGAAPVAGLSLPALPSGWRYEGWVVDTTGDAPVPVSTGTFLAVDEADSDAGGAAAGPDTTPPFPGQDFIDPARVLTSGYAAVISIEPDPDNGPEPYQLKPLAVDIGAGLAPALQALNNVIADNTISGTVAVIDE